MRCRECWESPKQASPNPEAFRTVLDGYKASTVGAGCLCLWQRPPHTKMGPQYGVEGRQGLMGTLRQAEESSGEARGNSGSLPGRPLPSRKFLALFQVGCKATGFGAGCLCLSWNTHKRENRGTGWRGQTVGTQGAVVAGRREKRRDCRECREPWKEVSHIPETRLARVLCKTPGFGAAYLCFSRKAPTSENGAVE